MSPYGKLRLKGKALVVKDGGIKKKKQKERYVTSNTVGHDRLTDLTNLNGNGTDGGGYDQDDHLTPAERRYLERWQKIELQRLAKNAKKSLRDRIHIPKVGPG
ncbi:hypothetical protein OROHE_013577 [Orobanche hederae]